MYENHEVPKFDEHLDDFCFTLGMALRRLLELEPDEDEESEDDDWNELFDAIRSQE